MVDISKIRREFSRFCRYLGGRYKSEKVGNSIVLRCVFEDSIGINTYMSKTEGEEVDWLDIEGEKWHPEFPKRSHFSIEGRIITLDLPSGKCSATFNMRSTISCSEIRVRELVVELTPDLGIVRVEGRE